MTTSELLKTQQIVKEMYERETIEVVQKRANQMYELMISKGYSHLKAVKEILEHGITYDDLMSGILTKGIEG